jgi:type I restriction enzyme S subunit
MTIEECLDTSLVTKTKSILTTEYLQAGRFPIIDQSASFIAGWTDDESAVITGGLPLVVFGDHTRTLKFVDFSFARGADGTQLLRTTPGIDTRFFYFACRFVDVPPRGYNRHFTLLRQQELLVPENLDEQQRIAAALDLVQKSADGHGTALLQTETLKRAVMQELFTRGPRGGEPQESAIGLIPKGWGLKSVFDVCDIWSGGTPRKGIDEFWHGDIPWVSGKDLKRPTISDAIDHLSSAGVEAGSRLAPEDAVLLLVRGMGLAKSLPVAAITRPMAFNQDVKALVLKPGYADFSGRFLRSAIHAGKDRLLSQIVPSAHGTMTLNLNDVESMLLPWPPASEDAAHVVEVIDAFDAKIDLHRQMKALYEELFRALLHGLMSREIDVNSLDLSALPTTEGVPA